MKYLFVFAFLFSFFFGHCQEKNKLSEAVKTEISADSIERAFLDEKLFYTTVIRLHPNNAAFIFIDNDYVTQSIKDVSVKKLYETSEYLSPENREAFYQKISNALPKEDIRVFDRIWSVKEVRQQIGGDGGLHTLVTWITQKPTAKDPYYYIEVRRLYLERLGTCIPIGYIKMHSKTNDLLVMDTEGEYLPIAKWRKIK
ncbi:hypothetical protein E6C50_01515 [Flavobacterium supellecticarium]|uniref:Uncharacterized protein n=1 Tax=Flavobacterium supellecticarium TaxID=2565924 RepID=A0A4S4A3C9_9FLAO|nr:hypothetical protein [Flavobacterium supellecticarium]THF52912.1 hypothetical protein E6C50_01515 [Flavobacterium supellecticarium]